MGWGAASNLTVGFVTEDGETVLNFVSTGASTIFPQGTAYGLTSTSGPKLQALGMF